MNCTCQYCGRPLGVVTTADGNYCAQCMSEGFKIIKQEDKRIIRSAFITLLLPLIITGIAFLVASVSYWIDGTFHDNAIAIFLATFLVGLICGGRLTKNFKAYVGEPELVVTKTTYTSDSIGPITRRTKHRDYSFRQIFNSLYNLVLSILGAVIIYTIGWLLFIIICFKHNRSLIILHKNFKTVAKDIDFKIDQIIENLTHEKTEVVNVRINDAELSYLPYWLLQDDKITIIYGVLNQGKHIPFPLPILYYHTIDVAMPALGLYQCLLDPEKTAEEFEVAFNAIPSHHEIMKKHWTKGCQKLLDVDSFFSEKVD